MAKRSRIGVNEREVTKVLSEEDRQRLKEEILSLLEKRSVEEIEIALCQLDRKNIK